MASRNVLSINVLGDKPLTADGTFTYAYDALSRLIAAYSNGTLVVSNRYDHLGRRVVKIAADGTHTFLYDGWRPLVETVVRPDSVTDRIDYVWGKDISGTLDGAGTSRCMDRFDIIPS